MADTAIQTAETAQRAHVRRYTYAEVVAELTESNQPSELHDGQLVMSPAPSVRHQEVLLRFCECLRNWVRTRSLGWVGTAPLDMVLSPHQAMQPDVLFIASNRMGILERVVNGPADLVAEVISLGTRNRDRIEKRDLYEQYGVKEYWIIDPEAGTIDVQFLEKNCYELVVRARPGEQATSRLLAGFSVDVRALFADLVGSE